MLTAADGVTFSAGIVAYAVLGWYATATDAIPVEAGTALMAYVEDNAERVGVLQIAGFLLFTTGVLALAVALWRARSVPRWLLVVLALLTIAPFPLGQSGLVLDIVQAVQRGVGEE